MKLPLATALARITCDPARILGIEAGTLSVGRAGRHLRLRSGGLLPCHPRINPQPGQEHPLPRPGTARPCALHTDRRYLAFSTAFA